ncbi:hypothetical protein COB57_05615 [Candidatus Peregrinibacteria bacterium]|nr:MAG: hypothetical protein COB57_05615 [Candidatus Peregrinibacteria bacterium]
MYKHNVETLNSYQSLQKFFQEAESEEFNSNIPENKTAICEYWWEFIREMSFLHRSHSSLKSIREHLRALMRHSDIHTIDQATTANIKAYLQNRQQERNWDPNTYNTSISKLSSYFKYLVEEGHIKENPLRNIRKMRRTKKNHLTMTEEQFNQLLGYIVKQKSGLVALRDKVFFLVLGLTGVRRSEALRIEISDLNFVNDTMKIHGVKGSKPRMLRIPEGLRSSMKEYLSYRKEINRLDEPYLFISATTKGNPWTESGVRKTMNRLSQKLGFPIQSHAFRRYVATSLAEQGKPIEKIMQYLGHTSIRTTLIYINSCSSKLLDSCMDSMEQRIKGLDL